MNRRTDWQTETDRQTNRRTGEQAAKFSYRDFVPKIKGFRVFTFGDKKILLLLFVLSCLKIENGNKTNIDKFWILKKVFLAPIVFKLWVR